jgi:uncharacterized damage-inducible protein DinB
MIGRRRWFERTFDLGHPVEMFPDVLERLRGTPPRLEEAVGALGRDALVARVENGWSIQENVGHLYDLEPLWAGRLDDLLSGENSLRPADLSNEQTDRAGHNEREISDLLASFRTFRLDITGRLEALTEEQLQLKSFHPRLELPMTAVDLFFFVAEHDDHHLARITEIVRRSGG